MNDWRKFLDFALILGPAIAAWYGLANGIDELWEFGLLLLFVSVAIDVARIRRGVQ